MYCLCVNVYCHRVTTKLLLTNISVSIAVPAIHYGCETWTDIKQHGRGIGTEETKRLVSVEALQCGGGSTKQVKRREMLWTRRCGNCTSNKID
jgi:hypothetical protein